MTSTQDPRRIEYVPLRALIPDSRNPKAHDEEVIDASIGRFGVLDLIVRDERTGFIVSGHGRHKAFSAMQARGEAAPEGVQVGDGGEWLVPVVVGWASRTDTEAGAALIALNRTSELGGWVDDALLALLDELGDDAEGFTGTGYTDFDREALEYLTREEPPSLDDLAKQHPPRDEDFTGSTSAGRGPITCPNCGHDIEQ